MSVPVVEAVAVFGAVEPVDPLLGGGEQGRADQADVGGLLDPGQLREVADQRALGAGLGGEVEVFERLGRGEGGGADPLPGAGRLAREHLGPADASRNCS